MHFDLEQNILNMITIIVIIINNELRTTIVIIKPRH